MASEKPSAASSPPNAVEGSVADSGSDSAASENADGIAQPPVEGVPAEESAAVKDEVPTSQGVVEEAPAKEVSEVPVGSSDANQDVQKVEEKTSPELVSPPTSERSNKSKTSQPPAPAVSTADVTESGPPGVVAVFADPESTLGAARKARDEGFVKWDVHTPFPVHGMDEAMGLGRSPVPWITFAAGATGLLFAVGLQYWTMVESWPLNYGGKPFAAWPSFIPITFEMTVLFAGLATAFGALLLGGVFCLRKPKVHSLVTSHQFAIHVDAADPKYNEAKVLALFEGQGALTVRAYKETK